MKKFLSWLVSDWIKIMLRPIYFYTFVEKGAWTDRSLTFLVASSWAFSFILSIAVFLLAVAQMLYNLISGIQGIKLFIVLPVFSLLSLTFFFMIFLITGAIVAVASVAIFWVISQLINYICVRLGAESKIDQVIKAVCYSSAVFVILWIAPILAICSKYHCISYDNFVVGIELAIFIAIIYLWGLWSISIRRIFGFSKIKSVLISLIVVLLVLLLQVVATKFLIPKLEMWIA